MEENINNSPTEALVATLSTATLQPMKPASLAHVALQSEKAATGISALYVWNGT